MKKRFLAALATGLFLVGMGGVAQAYSLGDGTDVGQLDNLIGYKYLADSRLANENAFIEEVLGVGYAITDSDKYNVSKTQWYGVTGLTGGYAHTLIQDPGWFFIKVANPNGTNTPYTHFLYENKISTDWAVITLQFSIPGVDGQGQPITIDLGSIQNIGKVSHIGEVGGTPVPEPATMLLFGTGLAGLAAVARRRKN